MIPLLASANVGRSNGPLTGMNMARRATSHKSRTAPAQPAAPESPSHATPKKPKGPADSTRSLQQRIDELERELAEAKARIGDLQQRQSQIADRIAWALDSLHDLMDEGS